MLFLGAGKDDKFQSKLCCKHYIYDLFPSHLIENQLRSAKICFKSPPNFQIKVEPSNQ